MPEPQVLTGVALTMLAGTLNGLFPLPMKLMKRWKWEHTWFVYSLVGMLVFPWLVAILSTPRLGDLLSEAPIALIAGFGLAWGLGSVAFGLALVRLGVGLGQAFMMGLTAGVGSLVPMLVLRPQALGTRAGHFVLAGNAVLIIGIGLCAYAGHLREKAQGRQESPGASEQSLLLGLLLGSAAVVLGCGLNFSFAFTGTTQARAVELGASPALASMAVWAVTVTAGFVVNAGYCLWRMRNSGRSYFTMPGAGRYWVGGTMMGLLWFGCLVVYGIGGSKLGPMAAVVGWPVLNGAVIIASNVVGWLTGEWKDTGTRCVTYLISGIVVILVSIVLLAQGNMP